MEQENKSSVGPMIGTIIIIAIIILGGLYFWGKRIEESRLEDNLIQTSEESATTSSPAAISDSDDLTTIEAELNATEIGEMSAELE